MLTEQPSCKTVAGEQRNDKHQRYTWLVLTQCHAEVFVLAADHLLCSLSFNASYADYATTLLAVKRWSPSKKATQTNALCPVGYLLSKALYELNAGDHERVLCRASIRHWTGRVK